MVSRTSRGEDYCIQKQLDIVDDFDFSFLIFNFAVQCSVPNERGVYGDK